MIRQYAPDFIYNRSLGFDVGFGDDSLKFFVCIFCANFCRSKVREIRREYLFGLFCGIDCYCQFGRGFHVCGCHFGLFALLFGCHEFNMK